MSDSWAQKLSQKEDLEKKLWLEMCVRYGKVFTAKELDDFIQDALSNHVKSCPDNIEPFHFLCSVIDSKVETGLKELRNRLWCHALRRHGRKHLGDELEEAVQEAIYKWLSGCRVNHKNL